MNHTLKDIAYARSGDKGRHANIGLIAHTDAGYAFLQQHITAERVHAYFEALPVTDVVRYELPNLGALNFVLHNVLGKGGSQSLASDAQGKALGQALLMMPLEITETELAPARAEVTA
ncbi:MAG: hypothetical protein NXI04_01825 [Planctomycetaceae bacterium]|nr:hypothetical protein [Planctomycetaceae bacterium]